MSDEKDTGFLPPEHAPMFYDHFAGERVYTRDNFAGNLKRLLGIHGLTAADASKLLGISTTTLSYWLNGERDPAVGSLMKVAEFFGVDGFKLLGQYTGSFIVEELANLERWEAVEQKVGGGSLPTATREVTPIRKKGKK
jgi:transcriptional regulator with XRE-family HTH domain